RGAVPRARDPNGAGGGLDRSGGVSRRVGVHDSSTTLTSHGTLYRSDGDVPSVVGWQLHGGSSPPVPITTASTTDNLLRMDSIDDRVEGSLFGIYASGTFRAVFDAPAPNPGPSNRNRTEVRLAGTRINSIIGDLLLFGAESFSDTVTPGDGNVARVELTGVHGSGPNLNLYGNSVGPDSEELLPAYAGTGNQLEVLGNSAT